jgi:large subunit ribosomal protein L21
MYAVIESGGKQYRVELGTELAVDRLDAQPGQTIEFERVLLIADGDQASIGRPTVDGARVTADVVRQDRGDKIVVFKYRPKARSRVKQGHRADLTVLRVADIELGRKSARKLAADAQTERERLESAAAEAAAKQAEADKTLAAKLAAEAAEAAEAAATDEATPPSKPRATKPKATTKAEPKASARAEPKATTKAEPKATARTQSKAPAKPKTSASRTQAPPPGSKPARPPKKKDE